jgi:predicted Zn-dependent protease/uncharacterized RDD family membrane protein YckC
MDARPGDNVPAGFLRRAAAYLIDSLVVTLLWGLAFVILCIIAAVFDPQGEDSDTYGAILLVAAPVLWFLYQWACNSIGASIGKKRMSLAVRRMPEDTRPGVGRGLVRTVGQVLGALPLGLGFWWALWDAKKQGWHDKMAGTHVVRLERAPAPARAEPRAPKWLPRWMRSRYAKYADPLALKKALEEPLPIDAASTPLDMPLWPGPQPLYALYFLAGIVPLVAFRLAFGFHLDLPTLLLIAGDLLLAIGGGVELAGLNRRLQVSGEGIRLVKIYGTRTISWLQVQRVEAKPDLLSMRAIGQGIRVSWDCRLVPLEKRKDIIIAIRARLPLGVPIQEWPKGGQLLAWAFRSAVTFAAMGLFLAASFMGASGFTGAIQGPCTGDQLAECLEPQVELQSISRPSCDGSGRRVCLVPLGQIRPDLVQNLVDHWGQYGLSITVLTPSAVPSDIVNPGRGQFDAPTLIDYMGSLFPDAFSDPSAVVIGLTPIDLFDQGSHFRYVFGVKGTTANPKAIISTLRMNPAAYGESPNDELLFSRARKLLARYIGLLYYGLPLSSDRRSPLYESIRGPADLDSMDENLPLPQAR